MSPALLADLLVGIHLIWVLFIILMVPVVFIGARAGLNFVRNFWLRTVHLLMMAYVAGEALLGIPCPLTVWENQARRAAGEAGYERSFIGKLMHDLLYYDLPPAVFTTAYVLFTLLIVLMMIRVPVDRPFRRRGEEDQKEAPGS